MIHNPYTCTKAKRQRSRPRLETGGLADDTLTYINTHLSQRLQRRQRINKMHRVSRSYLQVIQAVSCDCIHLATHTRDVEHHRIVQGSPDEPDAQATVTIVRGVTWRADRPTLTDVFDIDVGATSDCQNRIQTTTRGE